jgi:hypothetical protein
MNDYELTLHYSIIPLYKKENLFRWFLGCFVSIYEGTPFNHVWLSLKDITGDIVCVDLSGYSNLPTNYNELKIYYCILKELKFTLTKVEYEKAINEIKNLRDVKYSYLKIVVLLINRKFGTKLLFDEYNTTSSEIIAKILKSIDEKYYLDYPQLCGLKELETYYKEFSL